MAAPKGDSRARLLDAAEELFAGKGFDGTSIREIAARAGDTLGTLSYHFESKDKLLEEVVRRRFDELAQERRTAYRAALAAAPDGRPTIELVVDSIVRPFVKRAICGEETWRRYIALLGRMMYVGNPVHYAAVAELTDPVARECLGWLRAAVPGASEVDLGYAYQFMVGCTIDSCSQVEHDRMHRITDGACNASNYDEVCTRLLRFISAGIRGVLGIAVPGKAEKQETAKQPAGARMSRKRG